MSYSRFLLLTAALAAAPLAAQAQTLSLGDALVQADGAAYANRIAAGTAAAQGAQELAALRGVLPSVRLEGGFARTTDPISAFGIALRQRRIAPPGGGGRPGAAGSSLAPRRLPRARGSGEGAGPPTSTTSVLGHHQQSLFIQQLVLLIEKADHGEHLVVHLLQGNPDQRGLELVR